MIVYVKAKSAKIRICKNVLFCCSTHDEYSIIEKNQVKCQKDVWKKSDIWKRTFTKIKQLCVFQNIIKMLLFIILIQVHCFIGSVYHFFYAAVH